MYQHVYVHIYIYIYIRVGRVGLEEAGVVAQDYTILYRPVFEARGSPCSTEVYAQSPY